MKKIIVFCLIYIFTLNANTYSQNCKYEKIESDKFTKKVLKVTRSQLLSDDIEKSKRGFEIYKVGLKAIDEGGIKILNMLIYNHYGDMSSNFTIGSGYTLDFLKQYDSSYTKAFSSIIGSSSSYVALLMDNDSTMVLPLANYVLDAAPTTYGDNYCTSIPLSLNEAVIEKLKKHKITDIRVNSYNDYFEIKIDKKRLTLISELLKCIE